MKWTKTKAAKQVSIIEEKINKIYDDVTVLNAGLDMSTDMGESILKIEHLEKKVCWLQQDLVRAKLRTLPRAELVKMFKYIV